MTNALTRRVGVVDSLSANEFAVLLNDEAVTGVFRISGFVAFRLDVKPTLIKYEQPPFKLSRMVQRDPALPFNRWLQETVAAKDDIVRPKRTLTILAMDDGVETRRWTVKGAWISEITYSDFDTGTGELMQETVLLQYESIEESWTG
ncbi:MAG: phage tail protein [bacterium]|nr:phage tail protein [bacterium]